MKHWLLLVLAVFTISLYQNCSATHEEGTDILASQGTSADDVDMVLSLAAYQNSLYPITQEVGACVTCHGVSQQPLHSVEDPVFAHDVMISFGLVDLRDPPNSVIVQKLQGGHQTFDAAFAQRVLDAVQAWSDELVANGGIIGVGPGVQPTYTSLFNNVFQPKCQTCHVPGQAGELIDYTDYASTINTGMIVPGNVSASDIVNYDEVGHEPTGMAPLLTNEERAALVEWIDRDALNN